MSFCMTVDKLCIPKKQQFLWNKFLFSFIFALFPIQVENPVVRIVFCGIGESKKYASPNGAADHSQGIHPLVIIPHNNMSPNGATEMRFMDMIPTGEYYAR